MNICFNTFRRRLQDIWLRCSAKNVTRIECPQNKIELLDVLNF